MARSRGRSGWALLPGSGFRAATQRPRQPAASATAQGKGFCFFWCRTRPAACSSVSAAVSSGVLSLLGFVSPWVAGRGSCLGEAGRCLGQSSRSRWQLGFLSPGSFRGATVCRAQRVADGSGEGEHRQCLVGGRRQPQSQLAIRWKLACRCSVSVQWWRVQLA
ncbi:hypothetical protein BD289DRAFT_142162 [Coniella lustricola]|uniref:Uncharacterized protein n=1 Tax=Coniella lustricola TaxID=2025994 RepID=A0A2T2ZV94_9PEZI|nr:hypothetical protein BD289DRAFT_142162 [Coniella lustricola]